MVAILNYYNDPKLSERKFVTKGDIVRANKNNEDFDLTTDKEYEIFDINAVDMVTIKNDKGIVDIYSVECFYN